MRWKHMHNVFLTHCAIHIFILHTQLQYIFAMQKLSSKITVINHHSHARSVCVKNTCAGIALTKKSVKYKGNDRIYDDLAVKSLCMRHLFDFAALAQSATELFWLLSLLFSPPVFLIITVSVKILPLTHFITSKGFL